MISYGRAWNRILYEQWTHVCHPQWRFLIRFVIERLTYWLMIIQLIARVSEHYVIRSSSCNASKQCILTILLDYMILFMSDYFVNLVKKGCVFA